MRSIFFCKNDKHIPLGGSSNQYLKYSSSGTATWASLPTASSSSAGIVSVDTNSIDLTNGKISLNSDKVADIIGTDILEGVASIAGFSKSEESSFIFAKRYNNSYANTNVNTFLSYTLNDDSYAQPPETSYWINQFVPNNSYPEVISIARIDIISDKSRNYFSINGQMIATTDANVKYFYLSNKHFKENSNGGNTIGNLYFNNINLEYIAIMNHNDSVYHPTLYLNNITNANSLKEIYLYKLNITTNNSYSPIDLNLSNYPMLRKITIDGFAANIPTPILNGFKSTSKYITIFSNKSYNGNYNNSHIRSYYNPDYKKTVIIISD